MEPREDQLGCLDAHAHAFAIGRPFGLFFQNSQLLSEREVLNGQFRSVAKQRSDQQPNRTEYAHAALQIAGIINSESILRARRASNHKSFVDKQYGINARDRSVARSPKLTEKPETGFYMCHESLQIGHVERRQGSRPNQPRSAGVGSSDACCSIPAD